MTILNIITKFKSPQLRFKKQVIIIAIVVSLCYLLFLVAMSQVNFLNSLYSMRFGIYEIRGDYADEIGARIREIDGYEGMLTVYNMYGLRYYDLFQAPYNFRIMEVKGIDEALSLIDGRLISGRVPVSAQEVILEARAARSNGLTVGSFIDVGVNDADILEVVGIFESSAIRGYRLNTDSSAQASSVHVKIARDKFNSFSLSMEGLINTYRDSLSLLPNDGNESDVSSTQEMIVTASSVLFAFVFGIMTLCLFNISSIYLNKRKHEFQVLRAMGYKHGYIIKNIYYEYISINMLGCAIGVCSATFISAAANIVFLGGRGTTIDLFTLYGFIFCFAAVIIAAAVVAFPVNKILKINEYIPGAN